MTSVILPFQASGFTTQVQNDLQIFYDQLKSELSEMKSITYDLKRDFKHFAEPKNEDDDDDDSLDSDDAAAMAALEEEASEDEDKIIKPPFADRLLRCIWQIQRTIRRGEAPIRTLATLDEKLSAYYDDLEDFKADRSRKEENGEGFADEGDE